MPPRTTRFEIKYRIEPALAARLRAWLEHYGHVQADEHGEGGTAAYHVHSLYLDGPDWSIYRDTRNGLFSRFKLRARTYAFHPTAEVFLEVKHRAGEAMWKTRAAVPRAEAIRLFEGGIPDMAPSPAMDNFRMQMDQRRATPRCWVSYRRHAYVGGTRDLVRITFDSAIVAAPPTPKMSEPARWHPLPEVRALVVLELKYTGAYPGWVGDMIRQFHLDRWSMSKYRQGVEVIRSLPAPAPIAGAASLSP